MTIIIIIIIITIITTIIMFGWVGVGQQQRHAQLITGKVREAHYGSILTLLRMIVMMMTTTTTMIVMMMMMMMMMSNHCSSILNAHNGNKNYPDY